MTQEDKEPIDNILYAAACGIKNTKIMTQEKKQLTPKGCKDCWHNYHCPMPQEGYDFNPDTCKYNPDNKQVMTPEEIDIDKELMELIPKEDLTEEQFNEAKRIWESERNMLKTVKYLQSVKFGKGMKLAMCYFDLYIDGE